jgi:hypothetical protein
MDSLYKKYAEACAETGHMKKSQSSMIEEMGHLEDYLPAPLIIEKSIVKGLRLKFMQEPF